jgi:16S rRNA (guanine966-N2)-methyltransferase
VLTFPDADGLRPTTDRVRETLFNWLGQTLDGKTCLDLFAGTGALGFEALSRGAKHVTLVERSAKVYAILKENAGRLGAQNCTLICGDGRAWLERDPGVYDVIFLDPPFAANLLDTLLPLACSRLSATGVIYVESGTPASVPEGWTLWRSGRAGVVHYGLVKREAHE